MTFLDKQRDQLRNQLKHHELEPISPFATRDPWLLVSCLQKSLRRAERQYALGAAKALIEVDAGRFWRRLTIIAFEDFGRADLELTAQIVTSAASKQWRIKRGGDWPVANFLVCKLLATPRDRFLDELCSTADAIIVKGFELPRTNDGPNAVDRLVAQAVELSSACERSIPGSRWRSLLPGACDAALSEMRVEEICGRDLFEVCMQGRRSSQTIMPVVLPLWLQAVEQSGDARSIATTPLPPALDLDGLPAWALDGYTRLGRTALHELHRRQPSVARLTSSRAPMQARIDSLQGLIFDVEGGLASEYLSHPIREDLHARTVGCWSGLAGDARLIGLDVMRRAIPELNAIRRDLWLASLNRAAVLV